MVLDAKALTWAAKNDIDTAKLKKARVPIYGKWYFPEIPPGVPLVNLETGEQQVFPERMVAGEVIYVLAADLSRVGLAPAGFSVMTLPAPSVVERGQQRREFARLVLGRASEGQTVLNAGFRHNGHVPIDEV